MTYLLALISYLLGSIPFALIVGKWKSNIDIREHGSGNLGATNTFRILGVKAGITVALLDISKSYIPVLIAMNSDVSWHPVFYGLLAVLGHTYPVFAQFRGGKAVATTGGLLLAFSPALFFAGVIAFATCLYTFRLVSLGSIIAASMVAWMSFYTEDMVLFFTMLSISFFIIFRHRKNIGKIIKKEEPKLWERKKTI